MANRHLTMILCLLMCVTACGSPQPQAVPSPTATALPPSPSPAPPPTNTPLPVPSPTPTLSGASSTVKIFLIALEDKGRSGKAIGCDDSVVPVTLTIPRTQGVLKAALTELLAIRQPYYGQSGLYNALHQSDLVLDEVSIENGRAIIRLSGSIVLGGVCDNPRLEAQLKETAFQFSTVSDVAVFVNGQRLEDVLSQR